MLITTADETRPPHTVPACWPPPPPPASLSPPQIIPQRLNREGVHNEKARAPSKIINVEAGSTASTPLCTATRNGHPLGPAFDRSQDHRLFCRSACLLRPSRSQPLPSSFPPHLQPPPWPPGEGLLQHLLPRSTGDAPASNHGPHETPNSNSPSDHCTHILEP